MGIVPRAGGRGWRGMGGRGAPVALIANVPFNIYPVRIELTRIQEINQPWYLNTEGEAYRAVLEELYFAEKCLWILSSGAERDRWVDRRVVYGSDAPAPDEPASLEDRISELFANIGFRIEQLGRRRHYERVPDGVASLPKSLAEHLKRMNKEPYFILWDSKFDCGARGLTADEERAIREYVTDFA